LFTLYLDFIEIEFSAEIKSVALRALRAKRTSCLSRDFNLADRFKIHIMHNPQLFRKNVVLDVLFVDLIVMVYSW